MRCAILFRGPVNDWRRAAWAARTGAYHVAYNGLTRLAPRAAAAIQRATHDTGRGRGRDGVVAAEYFEAVAADYRVIAEASGALGRDLFRGRRVLELGPGDTRAMALIGHLEGARAWEGFDAFDIQSRDARYLDAIYAPILARRGERRDADEILQDCIMHASPESLAKGGRRFDLVVSRAVLEHVRDLDALMIAVARVTTDDCVLVHKIDLRSHGIEHDHPLDFLRFSERAWRAMSSHIDLPNRARLSAYVGLGERAGLHTAWACTTHVIDIEVARAIRRELASPFRAMSAEELRVLGLWLVQVGPRHRLAGAPRGEVGEAPHALLSRH